MTGIIQTAEHNRHEDAALQRPLRNALTISSQRDYHSHPVALVSHRATIQIRGSHLSGSSQTSNRRNRYANARYSSQYARLKNVLISRHISKYYKSSLYPKTTPRSFRENNQVVLQTFGFWLKPPIGKKLARPSKYFFRERYEKGALANNGLLAGIRYETMSDSHKSRTPPGILTPDIMAPDTGTMRGRPEAIGIAMRKDSLITPVCSTLRADSYLTNEFTCQERKLLELFVTRRLVEYGPH